jgi:hypothetical protein
LHEKKRLTEYGLVRIIRILKPFDEYDGWGGNQRPPQIGDVGTLLDRLMAPGLKDRFVVEMSGEDGRTIWLSEFEEPELEPISLPTACPSVHIRGPRRTA